MTPLFRGTLAYFLVVALIGHFFIERPADVDVLLVLAVDAARQGGDGLLALLALIAIIAYFRGVPPGDITQHGCVAVLAFLLCILFSMLFAFVKASFPVFADAMGMDRFFADRFFAALDRLIFFETDPRKLAHSLTNELGWDWFLDVSVLVYGPVWGVLSKFLPTILILAGEPRDVADRYVALLIFSWIALGNVLAMTGYSTGPVYYDGIFDRETYAGLTDLLGTSQISASDIGLI
jgi:hypothetical protein